MGKAHYERKPANTGDILHGEAMVPAAYENYSAMGVAWGRLGWVLPGGIFVSERSLAERAARIMDREIERSRRP